MIHEIKTEKFTGLAVLVPDESYWPNLKYVKYSDGKEYFMLDYYFNENHTGGFLLWYKDFGGRKKYPKEGGLQVVGQWPGLTEKQAAEIVENVKPHGAKGTYLKEYNNIRPFYASAIQSLASLMQSIGCEQGKQYVILRRV